MRALRALSVACAVCLLSVTQVFSEETCVARVTLGTETAELRHCALSVYDEQGATLWFSATPIQADERETFWINGYPRDRDPDGKPRTMMHVAFCPGGGTSKADAGSVRSVELSLGSATSPLLFRQWVFTLPRDQALKIERLEGTLVPGGRLSGRITGGRTSDGVRHTWEAEFDLAVPERRAAAGAGCSDSERPQP